MNAWQKKILQLYNPCKYSNLKCADKPDLFDEASSLGVEVTSDFPDEEWKIQFTLMTVHGAGSCPSVIGRQRVESYGFPSRSPAP